MIIEGIFGAIMKLVLGIIGKLPDFNMTVPADIAPAIATIFGGIAYFLPISALMPLIFYKFFIHSGKAVIAIIKFVKSFIPTMGGP